MSDKFDIFQLIIPIIKGIANTFGLAVGVLLHKVSKEGPSIFAIENGHITISQCGRPTTNYFYKMKENHIDMKLNYQNTTKDGKLFKSSYIFLYNKKKQLI